jgi:general secretion pathway protein G
VIRRGFTLIEMLVVMAVVALLLTLAVPRYFGSLDKSRDNVLIQNLNVLRSTLDKFYADKGKYPASLDELVEMKYLRAIPIDPVTESAQTWIAVPSRDTEVQGVVDVKSGARGQSHDGRTYESL